MVRRDVLAGLAAVAAMIAPAQAWDRTAQRLPQQSLSQPGAGGMLLPPAPGSTPGGTSGYGPNVYVVPPPVFVQPGVDDSAEPLAGDAAPPLPTTPREVLTGAPSMPCGAGRVFDVLAGFCKRR